MELNRLFDLDTLAFDVETTGNHMRTDIPIGFSIAGDAHTAFYVPIQDMVYTQLLNADSTLFIAHNAIFDRSMIKKAGIHIDKVCCTMIAAHLCEEPELSLADLIIAKTGRYIRQFSELKTPLIVMPYEDMLAYSGPHSRAAWILWFGYEDDHYDWPGYEHELRRHILWDIFWKVEMPLVPVLSDMELDGVAVDRPYLSELGRYFDGKIKLLEYALSDWSDKLGMKVNFNSPDQIADLFYKKLKVKPNWRKTQSGRSTVEKKYLETIKGTHPIIPLYLLYKQMQTLKGRYVNGLLRDMVDGRVYTSYNQTGTRTGRLSSSDPALQNIPMRTEEGKKIRRAFIAREGYSLVKGDADQLELKMMAHWSKDKYMLDAFRNARDIHLETALRAYHDAKRRFDGKTTNFQVQYGGGTEEQKAAFYGAYPGVLIWTTKTRAEAVGLGYVRTLFNRKRTIPELQSEYEKAREHGEREAISTIVQGSSSEVVKVGMRRVWEDTKDTEIRMVLQNHDEVVLEVPDPLVSDVAHHLAERMYYDELDIPITYSVSVGKNWADMKEVIKGGKPVEAIRN